MQYLLVGGISIVLTVICTYIELKIFKKKHIGQFIRELGPEAHKKKMGTPTMGGISILLVATLVVAVCAIKYSILWLALIPFVGFGIVGFLDDSKKYTEKKNDGLTPKQKMICLFAITSIFIIAYFLIFNLPLQTIIPFANEIQTMSLPFAVVLIAFILLATSNAINITDGLDGLASGIVVIVMIFFTAVAYYMQDTPMVIFGVTITGAVLGFLIFNVKPAKIFLGDTGSLALGGAVASISILTYRPIYLAIVLLIPVLETLSVVLQVTYFKITHGKRLFKMAPLHHHFELSGFKEEQIVVVFWLITLVCCILAFVI